MKSSKRSFLTPRGNQTIGSKVKRVFDLLSAFLLLGGLVLFCWFVWQPVILYSPDGQFSRPFVVETPNKKRHGNEFYHLDVGEEFVLKKSKTLREPSLRILNTGESWVFLGAHSLTVKKPSPETKIPKDAWAVNRANIRPLILRFISDIHVFPYLYIPNCGWISSSPAGFDFQPE